MSIKSYKKSHLLEIQIADFMWFLGIQKILSIKNNNSFSLFEKPTREVVDQSNFLGVYRVGSKFGEDLQRTILTISWLGESLLWNLKNNSLLR